MNKLEKFSENLKDFKIPKLNSQFLRFDRKHYRLFKKYKNQCIFSDIVISNEQIIATLKEPTLEFGMMFYEHLQKLSSDFGFECALAIGDPIFRFTEKE